MKRFFASLIIAVTLALPAMAYDDIPQTHPHFYAIEYLRRNDVFPTGRLFNPDVLINKADFVQYLVKLHNPDFKITRDPIKLPFSDTKDNAWYAPYFKEAIRLGILDERDTHAQPYNKLTVFQATELLFHSRSIPIPRRHVGPIPYKDVEKNQSVASLIMRAIELGVVTPESKDNVGIYRRLTRSQAAHMIYKMDLVDLSDLSSAPQAASPSYELSLQKIIAAWELINNNYLRRDEVSKQELSDKAIRAMAEALGDPYSSYLDQSQNTAFSDEIDGSIEGIGAYIDVNDAGEVVIVSPISGSPAEKSGVKAGDIVKKVDDEDMAGKDVYDVVSKIKGPKGTTVKLTLKRNGGTVEISVVRDLVAIHALDFEVIEGDVLHVKFHQFNQNTIKEFYEVSEKLKNDPALRGMILDLRNNPGGLLNVAMSVLNYFLPNNAKAVIIDYGTLSYAQYSRGTGELSKVPTVVIINKGSASASEIVAGALQDYQLATIVGETSFGKGTVQEVNHFTDKSSLKITVAQWLTPNGNNIEKNGIKPDVEVINPKDSTADLQLQRALQELRKKIQ